MNIAELEVLRMLLQKYPKMTTQQAVNIMRELRRIKK